MLTFCRGAESLKHSMELRLVLSVAVRLLHHSSFPDYSLKERDTAVTCSTQANLDCLHQLCTDSSGEWC